ncbi:pyruvate kinase alpha/beta domain-containing protein, partial [uncultured Allobaculum sp.]|uniref:pyruvate kinase alpha/beta domain-containing protein n=1 Tax=uncultured Allobaculum sp. TaxID=1187017 RepID=UPI002593E7F4
MLISASHLHLDYGDGRSPILDDESMDAEVSEKIGLVGRNGAGKSSLLKILADPQTTAGKIIRKSGMKTHILEQNPVFTQKTIWQEMKAANDALSDPRDDYELKAILTRLKLDDFDAPIEPLSGGQKRRLSLALTLADRADLLLLDEPTNHLDIEMIEWLENWLSKTKATVITVTHDRRFLEQACTRILELTDGHLYSHPGSYAEYLEAREKREADEQARAAKRENLYRHELEWVRAGVQARSTKQKSRLDRFEELRAQRTSRQNKTMELRFPSERLGKKTLEWQNLSFGYTPEKILFHDFSYHCKRTDRIALVGPNGCGKSNINDAITHTCCLTAKDLNATAILAASSSGRTARMICRFRPACPVAAMTMHEKSRRQLAICWGVIPFLTGEVNSTDRIFSLSAEVAVKEGLVQAGDTVVITAGVPLGKSGNTNLITAQVTDT